MSTPIFPAHLFNPSEIRSHPAGSVLTGGVSLSNVQDVISLDGGGRWVVEYRGITLNSAEKRKAWEAWQAYLAQGAGVVYVPLVSIGDAPRPETDGVPDPVPDLVANDPVFPTTVERTTPYIEAEVQADGTARDSTLFITITTGSALVGGEKFSIGHYAYRIGRPLGADEFEIEPPLRHDVPAGTAINFDWPYVRCTMDVGSRSEINTFIGQLATADIVFSEKVEVVPDFPAPPPPETTSTITSIAADGWQGTTTSPEDPPSLKILVVNRQGFDATGSATTLLDLVYETKRVRQPYPNQGSFTTDQVALSERIMAADTITGVTNNSTLVSPKPIAAWVMADRLTVGDTVDWEIAAFHYFARLGKQVACVKVRANDGTTQTAWQTVSSTTLSTRYDDAVSPEVYAGTLDISGLADGALIWLEAEVYPHVGTSASVLKTEDIQPSVTNQYEFARRYFRRDTALAAAPPYAYVSSAGNDGTGVISTTAATAEASPFLTVQGVLTAARTQLGTTNGDFDNLHIRILNSVNFGSIPFNTYWQDIGAVIIERAPATARASAIVTMAATLRPRWSNKSTSLTEGSLIFRDCSISLGGAFAFQGEAANQLYVQFIDVSWDLNNLTTDVRSNAHFAFFGGSWADYSTNNFAATAEFVRCVRGITADVNGASVQQYVMVGCDFTNPGASNVADRAKDGLIVYNNRFKSPGATIIPIHVYGSVPGGDIGSFALVQNLVEFTSSTSSPCIAVANDSRDGNVVNGVMHHNTCTGDAEYGRWNLLYDDTVATARTHTFFSCKGNLGPQLNTKGDDFILDGTRIGNFAFEHGVGCAGNFTEDVAAGGDNFRQAYGGVGSVIAGGDPLYTDDQSTVASGPVAGSGGGTYTLGVSSPARDLFSEYLLGRDLAGNARATSGTIDAGVYA